MPKRFWQASLNNSKPANMQMHELIYLFLGWLLGVLSPGITERIRRKHRQRDLVNSVVGELAELQYTMAIVAIQMRTKVATVTDEFLDSVLPIFHSYNGPVNSPTFKEHLLELRKISEDQRRQAHILKQKQRRGLALKQYGLPFLSNQASELSFCSLDFQRRVFRVMAQLDLFNQQVSHLQRQFEMTFDSSITDSNLKAVESNLIEGYTQIATQAEFIAKQIEDVMNSHGGSKVTS